MGTFLKASDLTLDQFLELFQNLPVFEDDSVPIVWMEAPDGWTFAEWPGMEGSVPWHGAGRERSDEAVRKILQRSASGRVFNSDGELRWRAIPALGTSCWRTVFLGPGNWMNHALEDHSHILNGLSPHSSSSYLWGQQTSNTPGEWLDLRIPHRFRYPVAKQETGRVKIAIEEWRDGTGEPHFVRLCNLES